MSEPTTEAKDPPDMAIGRPYATEQQMPAIRWRRRHASSAGFQGVLEQAWQITTFNGRGAVIGRRIEWREVPTVGADAPDAGPI